MKHLFGPVNSRRLGLSLGVDLLPAKTCTYDCIYCEVGPTTHRTCRRREYTPTAGIIAELNILLADQEAMDHLEVITLTASGEPTLHRGLGKIILHLKRHTDKTVAVLTNGSLLHLPEVRQELAEADLVIPSLDAAREESYLRLNRPAGCATLEGLLSGLRAFRAEFSGRFWLEILLVNGINDSAADLDALVREVERIKPDRVQLNTVARPPLEPFARAVPAPVLARIGERFPAEVDVLTDNADHRRQTTARQRVNETAVVEILKRRPCTVHDVATALDLAADATERTLNHLAEQGTIQRTYHHDREYFQTH